MWLLFTLGYLSAVIELHLLSYNLSVTISNLCYSICTLTYFITSLFEDKLIKLFSSKSLGYVGIFLTAVSFILIGPWDLIIPRKIEIVCTGLGLLGFSGSLMYSNIYLVPTTSQIINYSTDVYGYEYNDILLDRITSLTNFFSNIGEIFGPIFAGLLSDYFGYSSGFAIISGISFILFLLYIIISNLKTYPKNRVAPDSVTLVKRIELETYRSTI